MTVAVKAVGRDGAADTEAGDGSTSKIEKAPHTPQPRTVCTKESPVIGARCLGG